MEVSPNTIHKWVTGTSRPREDNVRKIARVLRVDEVWLAFGKKPAATPVEEKREAAQAAGATLLLAGLIETHGGRVTFPGGEDGSPGIWVNMGNSRFGAVAVTPSITGNKCSFVVPEPVGDHRVIGLVLESADKEGHPACGFSACVDLVDLTEVPRQNLGGFSVVQIERRPNGKFKVEGERSILGAMASVEELASS